eukprot:Em0016g1146a
MSGKPLLLPEIYSGESQCWSDWIEHFESVAALNKWATEDEKLKWLKVRLAGKARTALQKLPRNVREEYGECLKALKQRFEPDSKKELYVAELHTRTRRKDEDWATFGDALKVLADKAYSDLEEKARERLALTQYLAHIENPQIAFGVRQKRPETVDAAVTATIELESYLGSTSGAQKGNIATTAVAGPETLAEALKVLNDRLQKLEVLVVNKAESSSAGLTRAQVCIEGFEFVGNFVVSVGLQDAGRCKQVTQFVGVVTMHEITVPAVSEMEIIVKPLCNVGSGIWMIENNPTVSCGAMVARAVMCSNKETFPIRVLNPCDSSIVLQKGVELAKMELIEQDLVQLNAASVGKSSGKESSVDQAELWNLVLGAGDQLNQNEKEMLFSLLMEYKDVFSFRSSDLGHTSLLQHRINTGSEGPIQCPPRRIPQARREDVRRLLREMLDNGIVEPSEGPWSSPIVLAKKKDGTLRFCVDYRKVNTITKRDAYPLPRIDDTLGTLGGSKFFTTMDLASGYWQVEMAPEDRPKTAFSTPEGLYQFRVMPFGLCNAPATFQRLMDRVLGTLKWSSCLVYFDDIIVVGSSFGDHLRHIASVLMKLREAGLKLKPTKYWSKSFILDTDASDCGIGAVLSQVNSDASECVIAYASRSLSRQEQRYCVTRRELLAVVEFVKHFREYLLGRRFTLRTDHGSLVWLKNFKEPEGQLARWLERLEEYDFTVVHRQGSLHNNADALSRIPCRQCGRSSHSKVVPEGSALVGVVNSLPFQTYTAEQMRQFQSVDPIIGPVYNAVSLGELPSSEELNTWGRENLEDANKSQFILPYVLHDEVLKELHEGASRRKSTAPKRRAGLQTLRAGYPMQTVCVDIMGPLPETNRGSKYVLVAADCFTKWVEVYGIPNQEALTVAVKLVDEMFCRFSPPEQIHSDQGRQFESELINEICKLLQIKKSHTTPYRPQGNGMVERFNRTLLDMLATAVGDNPADWENYIHKLCFAYNTSVHSSTGYSPFFLMFGRQAAIPVDLMYPLRREEEDNELPDFVQELKKRKAHGEQLKEGDLVWLFLPAVPRGQCRKLFHPWTGPYTVVKNMGSCTYKIKNQRGGRYQIVHFDRLKPCMKQSTEADVHPTPVERTKRAVVPQQTRVDANSRVSDEDLLLSDDDVEEGEHEDLPVDIPAGPAVGGAHGEQHPPPAAQEAPEAERRYPIRQRRAPDRYGPYIQH